MCREVGDTGKDRELQRSIADMLTPSSVWNKTLRRHAQLASLFRISQR